MVFSRAILLAMSLCMGAGEGEDAPAEAHAGVHALRREGRTSHKRKRKKRKAREPKPLPKSGGWDGSLDDPPPRKLVTDEVAGPDTVTHDQINQIVVSHRSEVVECVNRQRSEGSAQSGTLIMSWTIEPSGRTTNVAAMTPELSDQPIASCLAGLLQSVTFPKHTQPQEPISFPFRF